MRTRLLCAAVGALVGASFEAVQLTVALHRQPLAGAWPAVGLANVVLLIGVCALAADFPIARRAGKAALVSAGIPMLLPAPTVLDGMVRIVNPSDLALWIPLLFLNLLLLLMLGCAEAGIYLLATRPRPQA